MIYFIISLVCITISLIIDNTCKRDDENSPCISDNKELLSIFLMAIGICLFFYGLFNSAVLFFM